MTVSGTLATGGNKVSGGAPAATTSTAGSAFGSGIFLSGNDSFNGGTGAFLTFTPASGQTQTVSDVIGDQTGNGGAGSNAGSWGLTLNGAGTLVLSGANTFSGAVTVSNGLLAVNNSSGSGTGSGPVTVASGATVAGNGVIGSGLTLQAGSFFAPGSGIGTLTVSGAAGVTWAGTAEGVYTLSNAGATSSKLAVTNGPLTKTGAGPYVFNFQNSGAAGNTYTLATYASTNLVAADLSFVGLPSGLTGTLTVGPTQLQLAVASTTASAPPPVSTPVSSGGGGSPGGGGGGGGATSLWFYGALALIIAVRQASRRQNQVSREA